MAAYALEYADGRVTEIVADDDDSAMLSALSRFGPEAVADEHWNYCGPNDDGELFRRILIWSSRQEADKDDDENAFGQHSVAALTNVQRMQ